MLSGPVPRSGSTPSRRSRVSPVTTVSSRRYMRLGVMFDRDLPPESLIPFCRHLDAAEVDDVWVVEDLGWTGSISSAATALAATERLRVGIGIAPAPLRN